MLYDPPYTEHGTWSRVGGRLLLSPVVVGASKQEFRIRGRHLEWDWRYIRGLRLRPSSIEEWNAAHEVEIEPTVDWARAYRGMMEQLEAADAVEPD
jgi:hypothetical protein